MTKAKPKSKRGGARPGAGRKPKPKPIEAVTETPAEPEAPIEPEPKPNKRDGLNPKQERFVQEYLIDSNAKRAAIAAGYSAKTAEQQGWQLLHHPAVAAQLAKKQEALSEKMDVTAERVIDELAMLAFYDPADLAFLLDEEGNAVEITRPRDIAKLPLRIRKAIVGWGWDKAGNFTLKFAPKQATLQLLGQHLQLFRQPVDDSLLDGFAELIQAARRRAKTENTEARAVH